ncbi:MAG: acetate--CoA ligase family protein [Rhodobacter sp.]|nr:acetate--CoA ligase family protein [Rhodobacter sp.]
MILSEYKSKELIAQYGIAIPEGRVATTAAEAEARCREIKSAKYVVKAQIGAGGRGLAGGIRFAATPSGVREEAGRLLGKALVTNQTGTGGEIVGEVYVEAAVEIERDFYIAIVLDPGSARPTLLASARGGVEFEQMARMDPDVVSSLALDDGADVAAFLDKLGFPNSASAAEAVSAAARAFGANDMILLEINPFSLTKSGTWIAVDAKVALDGNAMFRHPDLEALSIDKTLSTAERVAQENEINLVKLDGNIGVVVNGAGLGLATNDMLVDAGGKPANFMDIRTTATSFHIAKGVELLLEDPAVKLILLNVHGGGMTVCDTVTEGVAFAYSRSQRKLPIVARLAGTNAEWAQRILSDRKLPVEICATMQSAVDRAVAISKGAR